MLLALLHIITYYSNPRYFVQSLGHFVQFLVSKATLLRQGIAAVEDVEAVVLETDSSFSVVRSSASASGSALSNICALSSEDCSG